MTDQKSPEINPDNEKREVLELIKRMDAVCEQVTNLPQNPNPRRDPFNYEPIDLNTGILRAPVNIQAVSEGMKIEGEPAGFDFFQVTDAYRDYVREMWGNKVSEAFYKGLKYKLEIYDAYKEFQSEDVDSIVGEYFLSENGEMIKLNWVEKEMETEREVFEDSPSANTKQVLGSVGSLQFNAVGIAVQILGDKLRSGESLA